MHDIKIIRKNSEFFLKKLSDRNIKIDLENLLKLDEQNRNLIQKKEKLEQDKKIISQKRDKSQFKRSKEISLEIDKLNNVQIETKNQIYLLIVSKILYFLFLLFL